MIPEIALSSPPLASFDVLAGQSVRHYATIGILSVAADAPLEEVAWLMSNNSVHAVVVVDDSDLEPPVIADTDLISAAASGEFDRLRAADVAATEAVSVALDGSLAEAARLLSEHGVSHLIVRDSRHRPVGIISSLDVARAICERS